MIQMPPRSGYASMGVVELPWLVSEWPPDWVKRVPFIVKDAFYAWRCRKDRKIPEGCHDGLPCSWIDKVKGKSLLEEFGFSLQNMPTNVRESMQRAQVSCRQGFDNGLRASYAFDAMIGYVPTPHQAPPPMAGPSKQPQASTAARNPKAESSQVQQNQQAACGQTEANAVVTRETSSEPETPLPGKCVKSKTPAQQVPSQAALRKAEEKAAAKELKRIQRLDDLHNRNALQRLDKERSEQHEAMMLSDSLMQQHLTKLAAQRKVIEQGPEQASAGAATKERVPKQRREALLAQGEKISDRQRPQMLSVEQHIANLTKERKASGLAVEQASAGAGAIAQTATAPPGPVAPAEPTLCREQERLVELIMSGRNVFYTGSAGTGKSTVLKAFVGRLREMGKTVHILAPTGKAALNIHGSTTWTYAGWNPDSMKRPLEQLQKAAHGKFVRKRFRETDVLVLDEVSMIENHHFERLNMVMKEGRGNTNQAFGGVQVVCTGDFCQLPPVKPYAYCMWCGRGNAIVAQDASYKCPQHGLFHDKDKWIFRSNAWAECDVQHVCLSTIHRQSDRKFINVLNKCRYGTNLNPWDKLLLDHPCNVTNAVKLFPTRNEVAEINNREFERLRSIKRTYTCLDTFDWNRAHTHLQWKSLRKPGDGSLEALSQHRYEPVAELKQGMLVVLLHNLDINEGLVNGSQGVIIKFKKHEDTDLPRRKDKIDRRSSLQAPIGHSTRKEENINTFVRQSASQEWPVVRFANGVIKPIIADCSIHELGDDKPYSLIARTLIPLIAAWAMTVHKSQGMTLDRVIVDMSKTFEEGQLYVALSRARNLEGLKVVGLGEDLRGGNAQVMEFLGAKFGIKAAED